MSDPVSAVFKMAERKRPFDHAMDLMMIVTMVSIPRPVEKLWSQSANSVLRPSRLPVRT